MASVVYNEFKRANAAGEIDLNADDFRFDLLMENTTADTENDGVVNVADITTLDRLDDTGYSQLALANEAVNKDDTNDRAEFDADDLSYTGLNGNGTRAVLGGLLKKYVDGTDANDLVVAYIEFDNPIPVGVNQIDVPWNAEGILQLS